MGLTGGGGLKGSWNVGDFITIFGFRLEKIPEYFRKWYRARRNA